MEKFIEFLKKIKVDQKTIEAIEKEGSDLEALAKAHNETQFDLFKAEGSFIDPLKKAAKDQGLAEAYTKAKKKLNSNFNLGFENKDLEAMDYEDVLIKAQEKFKAAGTEEVQKLNEEIFTKSKKIQELEESIPNIKAETKKESEDRINSILGQQVITKTIAGKKYILPLDEMIELYELKAKKEGIVFKADDKGNVEPWVGDHKLKKADGTGFETVDGLREKYLESYVEKSNGADQTQRQTETIDLKDVKNNTLQKYVTKAVEQTASV